MGYDLTEWDPDSETGDKYLFLAIDHHTKLSWGEPLRDKTGTSVHGAEMKLFSY